MFEEMTRELGRLEGSHQIPVSIMSDENGYFDRQCHATECMFQFKVHGDDWRQIVAETAVCPFCRHSAASIDWNTPEQSEHFKEVAISRVDRRLGQAMRRDAERWNRSQPREGFISITMRVEGRQRLVSLPPAAAEPMRLKIECSQMRMSLCRDWCCVLLPRMWTQRRRSALQPHNIWYSRCHRCAIASESRCVGSGYC